MFRKAIYGLVLAAAVLAGCEPKPLEQGKEIAREVENFKVKRFTKEDIMQAARLAGDSLVRTARAEQLAALEQGLQRGGVAEAVAYCRPEAYPSVTALAQVYGARAGRSSLKLRNPQNQVSGGVHEQLVAYSRTAKPEAKVQELNDSVVLYTKPIFIDKQLCLQCHGTPGQDIAEADYALLRQQYPADAATGYKMGDYRGMWHIAFKKRDLLQVLNLPKKRTRRF